MKAISDNEIIDTSRGHKRIGALFDENAMLNETNKDLLSIQADLLAALDAVVEGYPNNMTVARAVIAKARG